MSTYLYPLCGLLWLLSGQIAMAESAEDVGQLIAQNGTAAGLPACASCHSPDGLGNNAVGFPRLAGLPVPYLLQQLNDLADGSRTNAMMSPVARLLSPEQKQSLAAYYAALPVSSAPQPAIQSESSTQRAGKVLAMLGIPAQNLPACDRCHGVNGSGVGDHFPPLAGQSKIYIENQLINWKNGDRPAGAMDLMPGIARQLTVEQIKQVADYYAHFSQAAAPQPSHQGEQP